MDKRVLIIVAALVLVPLCVVGVWSVQGASMRDDFVQALRSDSITAVHRDLRGKTWTEEELSSAEVLKIPSSFGKEQSLERAIHSRGRIILSGSRFTYQGTIRDDSTGIVHVFGYRREGPPRWTWEGIHPSSLQKQIDRRLKQYEEFKRRIKKGTPPRGTG